MTISNEAIAAIAVGGLLAIIIPIAAVIIFKIKCRTAWLPSVFIGAGTFFVFALVLEQLLHLVMLPVVSDSKILYCVYGCLAAGVFEETGRFVAYKLFMKKHHEAQNAVMMGLGHGGFEAIAIIGMSMISNLVIALTVNAVGYDAALTQLTGGNAELAATVAAQINAVAELNFVSVGLSVFERIIAMTVHVYMSVIVYKSTEKGKLPLFPLAILLHAIIDASAAMYQVGVIKSMSAVYIAMVIILAAVSVPTYKIIAGERGKKS